MCTKSIESGINGGSQSDYGSLRRDPTLTADKEQGQKLHREKQVPKVKSNSLGRSLSSVGCHLGFSFQKYILWVISCVYIYI